MPKTTQIGKDLFARIGPALANDTGGLKQTTNALKAHVIIGNFAQSMALDIADLTLAAGGDLAPLDLDLGAQNDGVAPVTGDQVIDINRAFDIPSRWELTEDLDEQVLVYGVVVTNNDGTKLLLTIKEDVPVPLQYTGNFYNLPEMQAIFPKAAF